MLELVRCGSRWCCASALLVPAAAAEPASVQTAAVETVRTVGPAGVRRAGAGIAPRRRIQPDRRRRQRRSISPPAGPSRRVDLLFELAPESYEAAVLAARANFDRAEAELRQKQFVLAPAGPAADQGRRIRAALPGGRTTRPSRRPRSPRRRRRCKLAELELSRTKIVAPIGGRIGEPLVALGSFVEAEFGQATGEDRPAGPDPVVYRRAATSSGCETLAQAGGSSVAALLDRVTVQAHIAGRRPLPSVGAPGILQRGESTRSPGMIEVAATIRQSRSGAPARSVRPRHLHRGGRQQVLAAIPRGAERSDEHGALVRCVVQASGCGRAAADLACSGPTRSGCWSAVCSRARP